MKLLLFRIHSGGGWDVSASQPKITQHAGCGVAALPEFDAASEMSTISRLLVIAGLKSDPSELPPEERVLKAFRERRVGGGYSAKRSAHPAAAAGGMRILAGVASGGVAV